MLSFLRDFIGNIGQNLNVILLDEDALDAPRRYRVRPDQVLMAQGGVSLVLALFLLLLVLATPLRGLIPGLATDEMRSQARLNELRLAALEDSLTAQTTYLNYVKDVMMGRVRPGADSPAPQTDFDTGGIGALPRDPVSEDWEDHQQPAFSMNQMPAERPAALPVAMDLTQSVAAPRFPVLPPVDGFQTRGFDPRIGHYALDIAVTEGTVVRSVSDGYVVMADWTHEGGYVIAIQHSGGYLSVYKHNQRLLKRPGDRIAARDRIALSGNTGEVTTGPHLHFELWRDGLAQDPSDYLLAL